MDKTLPYYGVIMIKEDLTAYPTYTLPEGYSFSTFEPGYEKSWADIEVSVGEFDDRQEALDYFKREFGSEPEELKRRCIFVRDRSGEFVATTTAWYGTLLSKAAMPRIHWVAVKPEHQGRGLAKALMTKAFVTLNDIYDGGGVYLTTQTWSYKAINMYLEFGFKPYLGIKPDNWNKEHGDFESDNKRAWEIIFSRLGKL